MFRKEYDIVSLESSIKKFLNTSVTKNGVFGGNPNVAIIVPKRTKGAYIELLSGIRTQREFLIGNNFYLNEILNKDGLHIYEVLKNE